MFGIKNAGRTARQYEFVIGGGVDQSLTFGATIGLLDSDSALRNHSIQLSGTGKRLIR